MNVTTTAPDHVAQAERALADVHDRLTAGDPKVRPQDLHQAESGLRFAQAQREAAERAEQQRAEQERQQADAERRQAALKTLAAAQERRDRAEDAAHAAIVALVEAGGAFDRALEAAHPLTESTEVPSGAVQLGGRVWRGLDVVPLVRALAERAHGEAYQAELVRRRAARQDG